MKTGGARIRTGDHSTIPGTYRDGNGENRPKPRADEVTDVERGRLIRNIGQPFELRFWIRVREADSGCWEWIGQRDRDGYGRVCVGKRKHRVHRLAWEMLHGEAPADLCVIHTCDNPPCLNPDHLLLADHQENLRDRDRKKRQARGAANGRAILTVRKVRNIKRLIQQGEPCRAIAARYSVSIGAIDHIRRGLNWKHVA